MSQESIKFVDLARIHDPIKRELIEAMAMVIEGEQFVFGEELDAFEKEYAEYCGAKHCVGVNSGSDALRLCIEAMGIGRGDEVIVPANTFISTAFAVSENGGTPVFCDVNEESFNIAPEKIEEKITEKTRAIIPVHLYGQCADMKQIMEIAEKHSLQILEDAAQAHAATNAGKKSPVSVSACYSFYPGKNLGGFGDGGAVVTNDPKIAERIRGLRNYGSPQKYHHPVKGYNSRLDNIQAAVLRVKLRHLDGWTESRRKTAKNYSTMLSHEKNIVLPKEMAYGRHAFHIYCIRTKNRDGMKEYLEKKGIQTNIHYPKVVYAHGAYSSLGLGKGTCPVAEKLSGEILSLPMFPGMRADEVEKVCGAAREFVRKK